MRDREETSDPTGDGSTVGFGGRSADDLFRALASAPRRQVLFALSTLEESTLDELAAVLAGWAAAEAGGMATPDDHDRALALLHHVHLPVLDHAGLVTYDREVGTVELEPLDSDVQALLDRTTAGESPP